MTSTLVIGSRGSKLALAQAEIVRAQLSRFNPELALRVEIIKTTGDTSSDPLSLIGGKGVFTKELEQALLEERIDVAVHSLKDLPTIIPDQLQLAAISSRENCFDALVLRVGLEETAPSISRLAREAIVGTSSLRRSTQLKYLRSDLIIKDVRGNIDTRLRKLDDGQYDALILAGAGLRRLRLEHRIAAIISPTEMLPAVGQGALALETRGDDQLARSAVAQLDHVATRLACTAERALLRTLGGGCQLPIAAYGVVSGEELMLEALVADPSGTQVVRDHLSGYANRAEELGIDLGKRLLELGAQRLLNNG
jgi:hydroxymethylbilane synthase